MTSSMILDLFKRGRPASTAAETAYARIVAQAREPAFYRDLGAPDTPIGRFEMILLHAFLYFHRVKGAGPETRAVAQATFDLMFADMDASLREIGVGDLTVPKRMKRMAGSFYGRCETYEAALADPGDAALAAALARNVHGADDATENAGAARLAAYVRRAEASLAAAPLSALLADGPRFPAALDDAA